MTLDYRAIDGGLLELLLAVLEEGSITRAAERLGVTQSAVSHLLDKLRAITGDPLFVKSGRGIAPTPRAQGLAQQARSLLDDLRRFTSAADFDAAQLRTTFTIAANDLQRDLLLPRLLHRLRAQAPGVALHIVPSNVPTADMVRDPHVSLVITPRPPDASDLMQRRLLEDRYRVFYDATCRPAPQTAADYLQAEHVTVLYESRQRLHADAVLDERGVQRRFVATVPAMAGVAAFVQGSALLATMPGLLRFSLMRGLAHTELPLPDCPTLPMYAVWHVRHQADPAHRWLREALDAVAAEVSEQPTASAQAVAQQLEA